MNKIKWLSIIFGVLILIGLGALLVLPLPLPAKNIDFNINVNQNSHDATGFGSSAARLDSQITLAIPNNQADAVYQYLKDTYVGKDNILKETFPDIHLAGQSLSDVSIFTDEYYDTRHLDLYKNENSARHRRRLNTTNPADKKSGRELIQVKVTPPGRFDYRSELKYEVERPKRVESVDDTHPLIGLVIPAQRSDFKKLFTDVSIDPVRLRHIVTIQQTRSRVYINWDDVNIISFSVDKGSGNILWAQAGFSSVDIGLVEVAYTAADEAKRKVMWAIRDALVKDLKDHFSGMEQAADSKYGIVLTGLMRRINLIPYLIKFHII